MDELLPGLFHWTAYHPRIRQEVSSYYVVDDAVLIDPMTPAEGVEWFGERTPPRHIVLSNRHHYRDSERFVDAYGCDVRCERSGLYEFQHGEPVEGFEFGDRLTERIRALEVDAICSEDSALHIAIDDGVLAFADGLIRYGDGAIGFVPDFLIGDDPEAVKRGLRDSLQALLEEDFDHLLFAHGLPLIGGGRKELERFVASAG